MSEDDVIVTSVDGVRSVVAAPYVPPPPLWTLRGFEAAIDRPYVVPTWADSFHDGSSFYRSLPFRAYRERMRKRLDRILDRSGVEGIVAVLPEDRTHIVGYIIGEGTIIHYLFVREGRRGFGIARHLIAEWALTHPCVEASHDTKHGAPIIRALNLTHNPLAVEGRP